MLRRNPISNFSDQTASFICCAAVMNEALGRHFSEEPAFRVVSLCVICKSLAGERCQSSIFSLS